MVFLPKGVQIVDQPIEALRWCKERAIAAVFSIAYVAHTMRRIVRVHPTRTVEILSKGVTPFICRHECWFTSCLLCVRLKSFRSSRLRTPPTLRCARGVPICPAGEVDARVLEVCEVLLISMYKQRLDYSIYSVEPF